MRKSSRMGRARSRSASAAASLSLRSRYFSDFFLKNETRRRAGRRWSEVRGRRSEVRRRKSERNEAGASKTSALPNWSLVTREWDGTIVGRLCQTPFRRKSSVERGPILCMVKYGERRG